VRTLIQGGYVVAFDGRGHRILREGVVVFEDDTVIYVGKSYRGAVDRVIDAAGKLVSPGFINIHAIASIDITHLRLDGPGGGLRVSRETIVESKRDLDLRGEDLRVSALFCLAQLLKGGATTVVPITAMAPSRWEAPTAQAKTLAETAGELGARAYVSHPYRSAPRYWDEDGAFHFHWDEDAGMAGLERALQFVEEFEGAYDGRIRTMLFPYQFDTCSPTLLRRTKEAARARGLIIHMHTAQSLYEFHESRRRYGRTPVEYLYDTGFLDEQVILTHVIFTTSNPVTGYPARDHRDLEMLVETGVTVAHTPWIYSQKGDLLRSFGLYRSNGVNLAIGTDAFPMDMIREMRFAAIMGKAADGNPAVATARDVYNAATLSGAEALDRDDLGRLKVGAKADIVIVDLTAPHVGLIDDPIKTLVYFASQQDIETVLIDGKQVVKAGGIPHLDEKRLAREANRVNQKQKTAFVEQHPAGFSEDQLFPTSFPIE
jgi:cytosine/adenosine deaminase-related metal-dependent hydrolase